MRTTRALALFLALPAFACAAPGAPPLPSDAVVADLREVNGRTATVVVEPPAPLRGYRLSAASRVHRWVPEDIVSYVVKLKRREASTVGESWSDLDPPVKIELPLKEEIPRTKAVFANLRQGVYYRAYVVALGNVGGSVNAERLTLNAKTEATADFDFTATQDVVEAIGKSVTIVFDDVAFNGKAGLSLDQPEDGGYAQPEAAPSVSIGTLND